MARFSQLFLLTTALLGHGLSGRAHAATSATGEAHVREPISHPLVPGYERFHRSNADIHATAEGGLLLLQELNCTACHSTPKEWQLQLGKRGVLSLAEVGTRLSANTLREFLSDPRAFKPGTLMPQFRGLSSEDLDALTAYLGSLKNPANPSSPNQLKGDPLQGREIYHTIGCVACHAPADPKEYRPAEVAEGMTVELTTLPSVPIRFASHYSTAQLIEFLLDPLKVRHAGRMPDFPLTESQAADIAAYLQQGSSKASSGPISQAIAAPQLLQKGRDLFTAQHCNACHSVDSQDSTDSLPGAKPLTSLNPNQGCLAEAPLAQSHIPHYALHDHQREALRLALKQLHQPPPTLTARELSDRFLVQMNCYACHEWEGKGGLEKARAQYFTVHEASAHSLGEIGMLPPKLNHAGRKLTRKWMEKLLWGENGGVRPYMTARMPRFGKENTERFIDTFAEACKNPNPISIDTTGLLRHQRSEYGRILLGVGEKTSLGCVSCHGIKDRKSLGVPVVNLTHTVERLQPEYFKELLLNPQAVQPGTLMPPLFIGRKNADQEIEQLWTYLKEIDGARLPPGLLLEGDYELKPEETKRPIVFRTFLEGAGHQAIAVGFPQKVHFAFDALEVRPAILWKGRFVDAMTTWEERAMTPAKPLGTTVLTLPTHISFARLKSTTDPWPETPGHRYGYRFRGYRLDSQGVPTFLYTVDNLTIEETINPTDGGLLRRLQVKGRGEEWHFRGVATDAKPVSITWKNGSAQFEELLTWPQP